jgi:hypothetical protein
METTISKVYTPKAIILLNRIKRNLATKGVSGQQYNWEYDEVKKLCNDYMDKEIELNLKALALELDQHAAPGTWAM